MRFGWLVAAAMMISAGQAEAQRYYQFEIHGIADVLGIGPNLQGYRFDDTIDLAFDTSSATGSYYAFGQDLNGGSFFTTFTNSSGSTGGLSSSPEPGGPIFNFSIPLNSIMMGTTSQLVQTSNTAFAFNYKPDARYGDTVNSSSGQILSVSAQASNAAPTNVGASERIVMSVLPEPSSWMMLILGMGAVGYAMRRQKAVSQVQFA